MIDGQGKVVCADARAAQEMFALELPAEHPGVSNWIDEPAPNLFGSSLDRWSVVKRITRLEPTEAAARKLEAAAAQGVGEIELDIQCSAESVCYTSLEPRRAEVAKGA